MLQVRIHAPLCRHEESEKEHGRSGKASGLQVLCIMHHGLQDYASIFCEDLQFLQRLHVYLFLKTRSL